MSAGTRKVKPIWILLKQETVSGSGINWAICKSAPHSRQITTPAPYHSVFYRPDALPAAQPTAIRRAALTRKHDTLVRRAPGWQAAPDGQQAKKLVVTEGLGPRHGEVRRAQPDA